MRIVFKENQTIRELLSNYHLGKPKIHNLYMEKRVLVNKRLANFDKIYKKGDIVDINVDEENDVTPYERDIDVIYEDDYILIVNKPAGIIIHGNEDSLVNRVSNYFIKNNIKRKPRYANRIDLDTTGLVLFSKDYITQASLDYMMENKLIDKKYLALISGNPLQKGIIEQPICKHRSKNMMVVSKKGDYAKTEYEIIDALYQKSLALVTLHTGRTHQIRVHFAYIKCPLLGDELYGGDLSLINRQALHSFKLEFIHPITNERVIARSDMPDDMKNIVAEFKKIN